MNQPSSIRVLIVDDHIISRAGLASYVMSHPGMEDVGEAGNGREALELCERSQPDVVLMDVLMPGMDGLAATRAIRQRWPQIQVIAMINDEEQDLVQEALQAGAASYVFKNASADALIEAIYRAHTGQK